MSDSKDVDAVLAFMPRIFVFAVTLTSFTFQSSWPQLALFCEVLEGFIRYWCIFFLARARDDLSLLDLAHRNRVLVETLAYRP